MGIIVMPVYVPFLTGRGLAVGDVLSLQAITAFAVMLFEIPTGYLCDVLGRRRTILIGAALNLVGLIAFASVHGFAAYALVQLVLAAGLSLVSGADIALIYEILDAENADRATRAQAIGRYVFAQTAGEAVFGLVGGLLAAWSLTAVGWATAAEATLPLLLAVSLPRPQESRTSVRLRDVGKAISQLFRRPSLALLFVNMVVWGLSTFIAVWLLQPYWRQSGVGLNWFGLLWAGTLLTVALVGQRAHAISSLIGQRGTALFIALGPVIGYACMAWFSGIVGIAASFLFYASRGLNSVIFVEAFNHQLPASLRATMNSLSSAAFRLSFALVGPLVGAAVNHQGLSWTLAALAIGFLVCFVMLAVPLVRRIKADLQTS